MNKYEEALNSIKEGYDAYFIQNKYAGHYTQTTHSAEFDLLKNLKGEKKKWSLPYFQSLNHGTAIMQMSLKMKPALRSNICVTCAER